MLNGNMELTDEEKKTIVNWLAQKIVELRLTPVAIVLLESSKPLSFIGSQLLVFFQPIITSIFTKIPYEKFIAFLENRENLEILIKEIEKREDEFYEQRKKEKRG